MNKNKKVNNNKMNKIKNQPIKQNEQKTPKMTKNEQTTFKKTGFLYTT